MKYLLALLILTSCKPQPMPETTIAPIEVIAFKGAWNNQDWDRALIDAIEAEGLTALRPVDAKDFSLEPTSTLDWARLLIQMARFESNFKPTTTYQEAFADARGRRVVSSGLFQISIESSNARGCQFQSQGELLIAERNIKCAVKIFAYWVKRDGRIAGLGPGQWRGGARYWAVLRGTTDHTRKALDAIRKANL